MITCPSCNHQNPEGSLQCENCYTPLPATASCPNCGASVQSDATFCGQCGFNLQAENSSTPPVLEETAIDSLANIPIEEVSLNDRTAFSETTADILPETKVSPTITSPWDIDETETNTEPNGDRIESFPEQLPDQSAETTDPISTISETEFANLSDLSMAEEVALPEPAAVSPTNIESFEPSSSTVEQSELAFVELDEPKAESAKAQTFEVSTPEVSVNVTTPKTNSMARGDLVGATQLQMQTCSLLHVQSNTSVEISSDLDVVHIGKPNGQIPPDIDVAGFPDSEVVSRVHADLRIEGDAYYIEDVGSSNGTYINHAPLLRGNRHRLRAGDRIALGKGDLVTFIFQIH